MKTVHIREIDNGYLAEWTHDPDVAPFTLQQGAMAFISYAQLQSWLSEFLVE